MDKIDKKDFNISISSFNVNWKIMDTRINETSTISNSSTGITTGITTGTATALDKKQNKMIELKKNILKNILMLKNYYDPFFYCFQEANKYDEILQIFQTNEYEYNIGYSKPEYILTIWKYKYMKKLFVINDEFEAGRPFSIIVFKDLRFGVNFILINIHCGHNIDTKETFVKPIEKIFETKLNDFVSFDIKRIIIVGDFNRDIGMEIYHSTIKFFIDKKKFNMKGIQTKNKTCCSLEGYGYNKNYDQIIDSFEKPILIYPLNKEKWYNSKSSDHIGILCLIKNFI
jgi:hypothetical protein